jgi:hypothetical protein
LLLIAYAATVSACFRENEQALKTRILRALLSKVMQVSSASRASTSMQDFSAGARPRLPCRRKMDVRTLDACENAGFFTAL